jgi:hypothetical protein
MFANQLTVAPNISVPAPWCAALHAIVHWQIQHGAFQNGTAASVSDVKCALDIARYLKREDIDWAALANYATSVGVRDEFQTGIGFAAELFHTRLPSDSAESSMGQRRLERYIDFRAFPGQSWISRRRARIMSVWACERAMYRLRLHNWSPVFLTLTQWCLRLVCLPFLAYLVGGLVIATFRSRSALSEPSFLGRA